MQSRATVILQYRCSSGSTLTLGSVVRLLIWIGVGIGVRLGAWAGLARRVGVAETGVVMTMPVSGVEPVLLQGCPLTMRTW